MKGLTHVLSIMCESKLHNEIGYQKCIDFYFWTINSYEILSVIIFPNIPPAVCPELARNMIHGS
jgi:hypothetical protein